MQRGLAGFVRAVALEAVNLGATVAAGAEVALGGESSASHTAGVKQALRQVCGMIYDKATLRSGSKDRAACTKTHNTLGHRAQIAWHALCRF